MLLHRLWVFGTALLALECLGPPLRAATLNLAERPTQLVITALPAQGGGAVEALTPSSLAVTQGDTQAQVVSVQPLTGETADLQLFVLLDDSSRSSALGLHFSELRKFFEALPPTTQIAVGYMRNGTFITVEPFTSKHAAAANSLRLPLDAPGINGNPYFALSSLVKHWPSTEQVTRRAVLMLTDGVDRYFGTPSIDDPYVDTAIRDAAKQEIAVYSIYLRGAGRYGRGLYTTDFAQSRLLQVAEQTGGYAYFEGLTNPVTVAPFLSDLQLRLASQYRITVTGLQGTGLQSINVRSVVPDIKVTAPERVYLP